MNVESDKMKKIICILLSVNVVFFLIAFFSLNFETKDYIEEESETLMAIYVEDSSGDFVETNEFPGKGYSLDGEVSYCVNGSLLSYDSSSYEVKVKSTGTDYCYLYFVEGTFDFDYKETYEYLNQQIIADNGGTISGQSLSNATGIVKLDLSVIAVDPVSSSTGLFYDKDDYGISYYFRGLVDNNWVYWAGFYWQIIRIDGQGNIKLIYAGESATITSDDSIASYYFTNVDFDESWYGSFSDSKYTSSTIKTKLETWFKSNLNSYISDIGTDGIFCSDRTVAKKTSYSPTTIYDYDSQVDTYNYFGTLLRINNDVPTLICPVSFDRGTWSNSDTGNQSLSYPIGLISADEAMYAGITYSGQSIKSFLYNGYTYWTISPASFYKLSNNARGSWVYNIGGEGISSGTSRIDTLNGVRPVVYLSMDSLYISGDGTIDDPYTIS